MTADEIFKIINKVQRPEYYDIFTQYHLGDVDGACKIIQDCFGCSKQTAEEVIEILNEKWGEPLTPEQIEQVNEAERIAQQNKPKCPICQSTNLKMISFLEKLVLPDYSASKTYQCLNCFFRF